MKRRAVFIIGSLILCWCVMRYTDGALSYKAPYGITQFEALRRQPENTIDVLFVGTSHVYSDINPAVLWERHGIASFDLATGGACLVNSYYAIQEALKTQSPSLIVLEMFGSLRENLSSREIMDANWGLSGIRTQWESLGLSAPEGERLDYLMKYPYYHTRYKNVTKYDFEPYVHNYQYGGQSFFLYSEGEEKSYKGAVTLSHVENFEEFPDLSPVKGETPLSGENEEYLNKIVELVNGSGSRLLLIVSPYTGCTAEHQEKYNYIANRIRGKSVPFVNFNLLYSEMRLDSRIDFAETSHLSFWGMWKYSAYLADYLSEHYRLPDRRGEGRYASWEENAKWEEQIYRNFELARTQDTEMYVSMLDNPDYYVLYVFRNLSKEELPTSCLAEEIEETNLSQYTVIRSDGETEVVKASGEDDVVYHKDVGSSNVNLKWTGGQWELSSERKVYKKISKGIDIFVYDTYVDTLVDMVGLDAENGWVIVR